MKKYIGLLVLIAIMLCTVCGCTEVESGQNVDSSTTVVEPVVEQQEKVSLEDKLVSEIEGAYHKESKLPESSTTIGMIQLAEKYTEKWKQVADKYYDEILKYDDIIQINEDYYSSDDLHTFVSNMKANWEEYNQVHCENYAKTLRTIYGNGTIVGPLLADYEYEMQKDWALQLIDIYDQLY